MSRYIDADELLEKIKEYPYGYRGMIESDIADMPTVDVAEVRHGRWEVVDKGHGFSDWKCSVCGGSGRGDYLICPWCGAKMDGYFEEPEINPCRGCEDYDGKGGCISNGGCGARMDEVEE